MYSSNHHISGAIQVMASSKTETSWNTVYFCFYDPYQTLWFYNSCLCLCQVQHLHTYVSVPLEDLAGHHVALPRGSKSHYINPGSPSRKFTKSTIFEVGNLNHLKLGNIILECSWTLEVFKDWTKKEKSCEKRGVKRAMFARIFHLTLPPKDPKIAIYFSY